MTETTRRKRPLWPLYAILLITIAPLAFALIAYYFPDSGLRPQMRTHYGRLIQPQRPIPEQLTFRDINGDVFDLRQLLGHWLLINAGPGACPEDCVRGLYVLRNSHASQGKNVDRVQRIFLVTDDAPVSDVLEQAYKGTLVLRADADALASWLVPDSADPPASLREGLWFVDPLGNLMIQFPDAGKPEAVRDDLRTLLKNSRIG